MAIYIDYRNQPNRYCTAGCQNDLKNTEINNCKNQ